MHGRGTVLPVANRFEAQSREPFDDGWGTQEEESFLRTQFYDDRTKTILAKNDSPDLYFTYSLNPYRGCEHGCVYCYARPSHEYLSMNAAADFETKIMVKRDAPRLLEETFRKRQWTPQTILFSGDTDCYQPVERKLQLTRRCLEVCARFKNPVSLITKNFLITRDCDILRQLAAENLVHVLISVTTLDSVLTQTMEPRTSRPERRLAAIEILARSGVAVGVNVAPVVPGLNDEEIPAILRAAAEHGARFAGMSLVRLPFAVEPIFLDWLRREQPLKAERVIAHIKSVRGGKMSSSNFGERMRGAGPIAEVIRKLFNVYRRQAGLDAPLPPLRTDLFRSDAAQMQLFA